MAGERTVTMTTHDALFKEFYGSGADQSLVNAEAPLASILMKNKRADWVGDNFVQPVRFGSAVGLGYRALGQNLPEPGASPRGKAVFPAKRAYATAEFDREAIVASRNDKGAFAKVTVDEVEATEEGFLLHMVERALFGDSTGKLGEVNALSSGAGTTASPWVVTFTTTGTNAPKYKKKYFPQGAKIDFYSSAGVFQLTAQVVTAGNASVSFVLITTGSAIQPTALDLVYWQGNRNGECVGLAQIAPAAASTLYGISQTVNPNFMGSIRTIAGSLVYDDVNSIISDLEEEIGSPTLAVGSHKALRLLKNQSEELKRYTAAEVKSSDLKIGFKGLEVMTDKGPAPMIASQMCPDDEIWFIQQKYLQLVMRQDLGWFDDDGRMLLRDNNKDVYNARYGGYFELFCSKPNSVGVLRGFTVS